MTDGGATQLAGFDEFVAAQSKAEAVARIYALSGARPEPLGPGSKEKKSVLTALGSALGTSLDKKRPKTRLAHDLADLLAVRWQESFVSTGQTVTLDGLNALLRGAADHLRNQRPPAPAPEWLSAFAGFKPARSKLEAVNRISALTSSGAQDLGPGSKERKSVLTDMAKAWFPDVDQRLTKPNLGAVLADRLGTSWPAGCHSTGYTITLDGLNTILAGGEAYASMRGGSSFLSDLDEASALLGALRSELPHEWLGRECVPEMRDAEFAHWRQTEWPGWYFEFKGLPALINSFGGGPVKVKNTTFDYALTTPWDLKCHSIASGDTLLLNDHSSVLAQLEQGPLGFIVLSGDATQDPADGDFTTWHREYTARPGKTAPRGGLSGKPRLRKRAFATRSITALLIEDVWMLDTSIATGAMAVAQQGRQQSGATRPPKLSMRLDRALESELHAASVKLP